MEFINIGTDMINEEYFYPVVNTDKTIKPAGGFWCTKHLSPKYNEWIDFISQFTLLVIWEKKIHLDYQVPLLV